MKKFSIIGMLFVLLMLAGCGKQNKIETTEYVIYDVELEENKVLNYTVDIPNGDTRETLQALFVKLKEEPEAKNQKAAISPDIHINHFSLKDKHLILDFDSEYLKQTSFGEVLSRAAIVRTLCQIEGINKISFTIEGEPLVNQSGNLIGRMTEESFIDNEGADINNYEKADLKLYFATEDGTRLKPYVVNRVYNSNISLDKLVVEELIQGPQDGGSEDVGYATLGKETPLISVTTLDGVCYVNFGSDFLNREQNVTPEVAIYSIVNSLIELPDVSKVQISIDGNSEINYMETLSLTTTFERNLEIVDNAH